ncbi:MAG: cell division ATP-binding protein FtsE [Prevotella sp.]
MLIDYKKVSIYHTNEKPILCDVDFHVDEGEFIYIIGRVGSGKSTLLKSIYLELDIEDAECATVIGHDIKKLKRKHIPALRKELGIIFQDFQLLSDRTVYKNLYFVLRATGWKKKEDINKRITEVLTDVGMLEKADKYPHELSGGEQQRIAIARAILNNPKIIIADEPTGNLDPETADSIIQLLRQISQTGTAVVMSTHNMVLVNKYPGIVYCCKDSSLKEVTQDYNEIIIDDEENEQAQQ